MLNSALLNTALLNGGPSSLAVVAAHAVHKYRLEVRSKTGVMKATLPQVYGGEWTERKNAAHTLRFTYPRDTDQAEYLDSSNQVWLRDETGALLQRFNIKVALPSRSAKRLEIEVEAESTLAQLKDEVIIGYSATATVREHIKAWLDDYQHGPQPIRLGTIDPQFGSVSLALDIQAMTIREAFDSIYETIDEGYFFVDTSRRFNWKARIGKRRGQRIAYRKNLLAIRKSEDARQLFTRLYLYGAGNTTASALSLTDAGEPNPYIEANTGTYGVLSKAFIRKEITNADTLLAVAEAMLAEYSVPRVSYEVDCQELSYSNDGPDYSFDRQELGSTVAVYDAPMGITVSCEAVEIRHNLSNPLDVRIQLDQPRRDLVEYLDELVQRVETLETTPLLLSTATPQPVGLTASPGTSPLPSPGDHAHALDPDAVASILEEPEVISVIEEAIADAIPYGTDIQPIGTANSPGTGPNLAKDNHVHQGNHFSAASIGALPTLVEGNTFHTTGATKYGGMYLDAAPRIVSHI